MRRVLFFAFLLFAVALCRPSAAQGGSTCEPPIDGYCGCELDAGMELGVMNISLGDIATGPFVVTDSGDKKVTYHYGVCATMSDCNDAVVCSEKKREVLGTERKNIGSLDDVAYSVISPNTDSELPVNVSVKYTGTDGDTIIYLACDKKAVKPLFFHMYNDGAEKQYFFGLNFTDFCFEDVDPSSMESASMTTFTTSTPEVTPTPAMTSMIEPSSLEPETSSMEPEPTSVEPSSLEPEPTSVEPSSLEPEPTPTSPSMTTTDVPITKTASSTSFTATTSAAPVVTSSPRPGGENKDDKDRKIILAVVLSILGAVLVAVVMAIVIYYVWRKGHSTAYEKIPEM